MKRSVMLVITLALIIGCSDGGSSSDESSQNEYRPEDDPFMVGPPGAVLTIDDLDSPCYGLTVEVAPGELDDYRVFYLTDDYLNVPVTPYLPAGFLPGGRRHEGVFAVKTSGNPPYDVEMTITFPLSDVDINTATGEVFGAFYLDETVDDPDGRWRFVLPQTIDTDVMTMTLVTTYRQTWNWGRVDVADIDREYLEPALKERFGESEFAQILNRMDDIGNQVANEDPSYTSCTDLRALQIGLLEFLRQSAAERLVADQQYIDPTCGSCDPISDQFGSELFDFIEKKVDIWFVEMLADSAPNVVLEFYLRIQALIWNFEIMNMACDYECVHDELGIGFWLDYGEYHLAGGIQYMIDWYIWASGMNCPAN